MSQIVFVSSNGLVKALAISEAAKVEGSSPAILVKIRCQVIVVPGEGRIFCFSGLA